MTVRLVLIRISLAAALLGSLGACTVAPAYPVAYRPAPVYVETYPAYRYGHPTPYYGHEERHYGDRGGRYYRDEHRYQEPRRIESPLEGAARLHRDVRRSLGLPRLPGMP